MLPSSDFTITLNKSKDYLRCAVCIHVLAMIVLLRSALPPLIIYSLLLVLIITLVHIIRSKVPLPRYQKLSYHPGYWLLHEVGGKQTKYERAAVGFDGGLFVLLTLTGINLQKKLVIFKDQITIEQYRVIKLSSY